MKAKVNFQFVNTEEEAIALCEEKSKGLSRYMKKNNPPHYTKWQVKHEDAFVVFWYV